MSAIVEQALGLSYGATKGEDNWNLWLDENLIKIGAVAQISVASMSEDTPPGVFVEGRRVIVGPSPTGAYAGQAGKLTVGVEGNYKFYTILKGWDFYNEADGKRYTWSGSAFVDPVAAGITGKQNTLVSGTNIKTVDSQDITGSGNVVISKPYDIVVACSDEYTPITAGTKKVTIRATRNMTITGVLASLTTAQDDGAVVTVDINKNNSSIFSTLITIDNDEKTSATAVTPAVLSTSTISAGDEITFDIDQVGDGTATGLKVAIIGTVP